MTREEKLENFPNLTWLLKDLTHIIWNYFFLDKMIDKYEFIVSFFILIFGLKGEFNIEYYYFLVEATSRLEAYGK